MISFDAACARTGMAIKIAESAAEAKKRLRIVRVICIFHPSKAIYILQVCRVPAERGCPRFWSAAAEDLGQLETARQLIRCANLRQRSTANCIRSEERRVGKEGRSRWS